MARSAPRANASRITCATRAGPPEQTTTSPPFFSLRRSASSSAYASGSFISKLASASRIHVFESSRRGCHSRVGTCLIQTAIFIRSSGYLVIWLSGYWVVGNESWFVAFEEQRCVGAAEAERVRQRVAHRDLARGVR